MSEQESRDQLNKELVPKNKNNYLFYQRCYASFLISKLRIFFLDDEDKLIEWFLMHLKQSISRNSKQIPYADSTLEELQYLLKENDRYSSLKEKFHMTYMLTKMSRKELMLKTNANRWKASRLAESYSKDEKLEYDKDWETDFGFRKYVISVKSNIIMTRILEMIYND